METEETKVQPDAEEQDTDTGVDSETNDSSEDSNDLQVKYENQKIRAEKAETQLKQLKETLNGEEESKPEDENIDSNNTEALAREVEELKLAKMGYADEVITEIMELGGAKALANPITRKSADALQAEHDANKASDIDSGPQGSMKSKHTIADLEGMSVEELENVLPHAED